MRTRRSATPAVLARPIQTPCPERKARLSVSGFRTGLVLVPVPGPASLDLDFQREAQERPDENDAAEDQKTLERRLQGDRADDVGGHEELEPQKNGPPQVRSIEAESVGPGTAPQDLPEDEDRRSDDAEDDDGDAADFDGARRQFQGVRKPVVHERSFKLSGPSMIGQHGLRGRGDHSRQVGSGAAPDSSSLATGITPTPTSRILRPDRPAPRCSSPPRAS